MKNNYFDSDEKPKKAKSKKRKKKNKMSAGKIILLIISLIIIAATVFVITIKALEPDYDFTQLIPQKAVSYVKEDVLNKTTTEKTSEEKTAAKPTTTKKMMSYLEDTQFDFDVSKQGNFIGNLLNGGKVGYDYTYIYHIVDKKGIYRFSPSSESYSLIYETKDTLSSINLRGDFIYFVDETNGKLYKLQKGSSKPKAVAEDVKFAYVNDSLVYFITNSNSLCVMDVKQLTPTTVYYSADSELKFIGISKERVFFSVTDGDETDFLSVDNFAKSEALHFRESESQSLKNNFVMENGYLYYLEKDTEGGEGFYVVRQKFGSEKTKRLEKTKTNAFYPIADSNRLYFADFSGNKLIMKELNMNSETVKTMLKSDKLENENDAFIQHGYEYDFIIGNNNYKASSNLTSSTNVMKFKDGKWKY